MFVTMHTASNLKMTPVSKPFYALLGTLKGLKPSKLSLEPAWGSVTPDRTQHVCKTCRCLSLQCVCPWVPTFPYICEKIPSW